MNNDNYRNYINTAEHGNYRNLGYIENWNSNKGKDIGSMFENNKVNISAPININNLEFGLGNQAWTAPWPEHHHRNSGGDTWQLSSSSGSNSATSSPCPPQIPSSNGSPLHAQSNSDSQNSHYDTLSYCQSPDFVVEQFISNVLNCVTSSDEPVKQQPWNNNSTNSVIGLSTNSCLNNMMTAKNSFPNVAATHGHNEIPLGVSNRMMSPIGTRPLSNDLHTMPLLNEKQYINGNANQFPNSDFHQTKIFSSEFSNYFGNTSNSLYSKNSCQPTLCINEHKNAQKFYCQTCSESTCERCIFAFHTNHCIVSTMTAIDHAEEQANEVLHDAKDTISALQKELDSINMAFVALEQNAQQTTTDVILCVKKILSALEKREKQLLNRIDEAKNKKIQSLQTRRDHVKNSIDRLKMITDVLADTTASVLTTTSTNPLNLLVTKDLALAETFRARQTRMNLPPLEENWMLSFNGMETNLISQIENLGLIIKNSPGPIGDRRTIRGRGENPEFHINQNLLPPLHSIPRRTYNPFHKKPVIVACAREGFRGHTESVIEIGNKNEPADNLCRPWGIAIDSDGNIVVADRSNNRIQVYNSEGRIIHRFGKHGSGRGQFDRPAGVAVDSRKRIIVADKDNHRIQVFTMQGRFIMAFGSKGSDYGQFNYPWDLAVNSMCQIIVSDTRNHRVQLFSPEGIFLRKFGYEMCPAMWKNLDSPRGVAFNTEGNVVVTDFNNHRVVVIDNEFLAMKTLNPDENSGDKQFLRPQGVVIDDVGNVIVADSRNNRIQVFDPAGNLIWRFGKQGNGINEMDRPAGISLTPEGRIAVVDFGNNRILII